MAKLNIFVSFEFDKDEKLKNDFFWQAKKQTNHKIRNCSLSESYPNDKWKKKAKNAIAKCDVVVVLVGQDTHNASGVIVETDIARSICKPTFQIRNQRSNYSGLRHLDEPITWRWKTINAKLDAIASE